MANPILIAQDLSLYTPTATSTDSGYPLANLQTYLAADVWKSASLSQTQELKIDFGAAKDIDTVVIDGHNLHSLGLTSESYLYLSCSNNDSTWYQQKAWLGTDITSAKLYATFTVEAQRYWKLHFLKTGALDTYPQIGNLFLSNACDLGRPYDFHYPLYTQRYETALSKALDGTMRSSQPYAGRRQFELTWLSTKGGVSDTVITNFQTVFNTICRGMFRPFYFLDTDGTTLYYCHFGTDEDPSKKYRVNINDLRIPLIAQLVG